MIAVPMHVGTSKVLFHMDANSSSNVLPANVGTEYNSVVVETNFPPGGAQGDLLSKHSDSDYDVCWVTPADSAEEDNTRPITAAAVYTEIGNINALLATI